MQANLPYREGGANVPGLPFPRANMGVYIALTIVAALVAWIVPVLALGNGSLAVAWRAFRDGGPFMYLLLLAEGALPIVLAALGAFAIKGRKVPLAVLSGLAIAPAFVGIAGAMWSSSRWFGAISGDSVDPEQKIRIGLEGTSEEMQAIIFSSLICGVALGVVANASAGVVASIDRARLGVPAGLAWVASLLISLAWIFGAVVTAVFTRSLGNVAFVTSFFGSLVVLVIALLASRAASCVRGYQNAAEARRVAGALLIGAISAAFALYLIDRAAGLSGLAKSYSALSGESIDPSQRARILAQGMIESRAYGILAIVHAVGAFASFVPAIISASGRGTHPLGGGSMATVAMVLVALGGFFAVSASDHAKLTKIASMSNQAYPVSLPRVSDASTMKLAYGSVRVVSKSDAARGDLGDIYVPEYGAVPLACDKDLTMRDLEKRFTSSTKSGTAFHFTFLVESPKPVELSPLMKSDPFLASLVGQPKPGITMSVAFRELGMRAPSISIHASTIDVHAHSLTSITFAHGDDVEERVHGLVGQEEDIVIFVLPTTSVQDLVTVAAALSEHATIGVYYGSENDITRTLDKGALQNLLKDSGVTHDSPKK